MHNDQLQMWIGEGLQCESIEELINRITQACYDMQDDTSQLDKLQYWTDIIAALNRCRADIISIEKRCNKKGYI